VSIQTGVRKNWFETIAVLLFSTLLGMITLNKSK
jgi:hypothetical protein